MDQPIEITGFAVKERGKFYRLPESIIDKVNDGVTGLATHSAGGCLRFRTDSPQIAVKVTLLYTGGMSHMPLSGQSGIDVYFDDKFCGSVQPAGSADTEYEGAVCRFPTINGTCDIRINLPLYNGVSEVSIGIGDNSLIGKPSPYKTEQPMLFYGSSITQGGCASRPGNAYPALLSRWLSASHINLGFSGSARGEKIMAEYIASLDLSVFIMDYDHNAPNAEHLKATHENFFKIIREKNPVLPVVFVSKPDFDANVGESSVRRGIIRETYERTLAAGDGNVYFIDGETLFGTRDRLSATVDTCHPNDIGFMSMAETIYPVLKKILNKI